MLVLTRRLGQSIFLGRHYEMKVKILSVQGNNVRLGIEAPIDLPIIREEIRAEFPVEIEKVA